MIDWRYIARLAGLFFLYVITGRLGLTLNPVNHFAALVWPPSGIALVALFVMGYSLWPAIALGALIVNLSMGAPFLPSLFVGIGNSLAAILGAYLLRRLQFDRSLERLRDVIILSVFPAFSVSLLSATVGVFTLWRVGLIDGPQFLLTWRAWWIGDMTGILLIAPILLLWKRTSKIDLRPRYWIEVFFLAILMFALRFWVFQDESPQRNQLIYPTAFIIFPFVIWAAVRFGQKGTVIAIFLISLVNIFETYSGQGPFSFDSPAEGFLALQTFVGILSVVGMSLGALVAEQQHEKSLLLATEARLRFLADGCRILGQSLNYHSVLKELAQQLVPTLADWCVIYLLEDNHLVPAIFAHRHPLKEELAREHLRGSRPLLEAQHGAHRVLQTKRTEVLPVVSNLMELAKGLGCSSPQILQSLGTESSLCVPMISKPFEKDPHVIGSIALFFGESNRQYNEGDLAFVEDFACRAAQAIDNALMYKQVQESLSLLNTIFEYSPMGFAFLDPDCRYVRINQNLAELNGKSPEEHIGKTPAEVIPTVWKKLGPIVEEVRRTKKPSGPIEFTGNRTSPLRDQQDWIARYYPVISSQGEFLGMGAIVLEVTEQKKARERQNTINKLQEIGRMREEILASVSHDLKNPLTSILLSSRFLLQHLKTGSHLDEQLIQKQLQNILLSSEQMDSLINDLLEMAKAEAKDLTLTTQEENPGDLVSEAVGTLRPLAERKGILLSVESKPPLSLAVCNRQHILRVLSNLIGNGIKFTPAQGRVSVKVESTEEEVMFTVEDTGRGIPEKDIPHLFERYWRAQTTGAPGLGLGLYIAKGLVEANHGKIWVKSSPNQGSTFCFCLPSSRKRMAPIHLRAG